MVGIGHRSVAQLQAPHRETAAGKILFAGGADQRPRHAGDACLRRIARLVECRAVADECVAARGRRFEHVGLNATCQPLHHVNDAIDTPRALLTTVDVEDDCICTVRSVINPDKLGHLGRPLSPLAQRDQPSAPGRDAALNSALPFKDSVTSDSGQGNGDGPAELSR